MTDIFKWLSRLGLRQLERIRKVFRDMRHWQSICYRVLVKGVGKRQVFRETKILRCEKEYSFYVLWRSVVWGECTSLQITPCLS